MFWGLLKTPKDEVAEFEAFKLACQEEMILFADKIMVEKIAESLNEFEQWKTELSPDEYRMSLLVWGYTKGLKAHTDIMNHLEEWAQTWKKDNKKVVV